MLGRANSSVAALLHTSNGRYFVKALPADHRWVWTQAREAEIAQYVGSVAPALCARVVDLGWDVLIFDGLDGHQADYAPGSTDLRHVVDLLTRIGELPCPPVAPAPGITAFAKANVRVWAEIGGGEPDDWTRRLINAADSWHESRTVFNRR